MAAKDLNDIKSASYNKDEFLRSLRTGVMAELDASNQYSIMAEAAPDETVKKIILDIMHEEQVHVGEFLKLIEKICAEETERYEEGKNEAADKMGEGLPGTTFPPKPAIEPHPSTFIKKVAFTATPINTPNEEPGEDEEPASKEEPEEEEPTEDDYSMEQLSKELGNLLKEEDEEE